MRVRLALVGSVVAAGLALAACGGGSASSASSATPAASVAHTVGVKIGQSSLGPILTDVQGRTLYAFVNDKGSPSTCTGQCLATWPALVSTSAAVAGSGVQGSLLSKVVRSQGTDQVTYGQWPLYYYVGDQGPGDVDGQGVDGVWFVVGANGKLVKS